MRRSALSPRLQRALIPKYANENGKKCSMGDEGLKYPGLVLIPSRLKPSPRTPISDFRAREKQNAINLTEIPQVMMPNKERLCLFERFRRIKQLNKMLSISILLDGVLVDPKSPRIKSDLL